MRKFFYAILAACALAVSQASAGEIYKVGPPASAVSFKVRHIGVSLVHGEFQEFTGILTLDGERLYGFGGVVDVASLHTGIRARDKDLKSARFFATEQFPTMTVKSARVGKTEEGIEVETYLTIRDVTKLITFRGTLQRGDDQKMELNLKGTLNRKDFNLRLKKILELFVGDNVNIYLRLKAESPG